MSDLELPGMEGIERVELPFARQQPVYRVRWRLLVTGYVPFSTWEDPEAFMEDEDNTEGWYERLLDSHDAEVEYDDSWYQEIEVLQEDGSWKPVDAETYERIREHQERAA